MKTNFYVSDFADYIFIYDKKVYGASYAEKENSAKVIIVNGIGQIISYAKVDYIKGSVEIVIGSTSERMPWDGLDWETIPYIGSPLNSLARLMVRKYLASK
jgi:hypothetical protein